MTELSQPIRMTRQRELVLAQLSSFGGFQSAQQIHSSLSTSGNSIGLATVYRALQALGEAHAIDELQTDDGETLYRHCATDKHHHHLVCRDCGNTKEITGSNLENFLSGITNKHDFANLEHKIEVWGTCANCQSVKCN